MQWLQNWTQFHSLQAMEPGLVFMPVGYRNRCPFIIQNSWHAIGIGGLHYVCKHVKFIKGMLKSLGILERPHHLCNSHSIDILSANKHDKEEIDDDDEYLVLQFVIKEAHFKKYSFKILNFCYSFIYGYV